MIDRASWIAAITKDPKAAEPRWHASVQPSACSTVSESARFFAKYHLPTVPATVMTPMALTNCSDQKKAKRCQKERITLEEVEDAKLSPRSVQLTWFTGSAQIISVLLLAGEERTPATYE